MEGLSNRQIQAHLFETFGASITPSAISSITDAVLVELKEWQNRPLESVWPVIFIDAIFIKVRESQVANRPVYVAMGVNCAGEREVLGMWLGPTGGEGAKFWSGVLTELRNRGIVDVCFVCCDGLKGLPDAINATWPEALVQTCVVHLVRNAFRYASRADWQDLSRDMRAIYTAPTLEAAEARFDELPEVWLYRRSALVGNAYNSLDPYYPVEKVFDEGPGVLLKNLGFSPNGSNVYSPSGARRWQNFLL